MLYESRVDANVIDSSDAYKECAELCPDCPRRTGEKTVKAKRIKGLIGKKVTRSVHSDPLRSGRLKSLQTNGRDGIFYGEGTENTGTVTGLNTDNASKFVEAVATCEGPLDKGNTCRALGSKSLSAIYDLGASMEDTIDTLPVEAIVQSVALDSTKAPATDIQATQVFINNSQPSY